MASVPQLNTDIDDYSGLYDVREKLLEPCRVSPSKGLDISFFCKNRNRKGFWWSQNRFESKHQNIYFVRTAV